MPRLLDYFAWFQTVITAENSVFGIAICAAGTVAALWLITHYAPRWLPYVRIALVVALICLSIISMQQVGG